MSVSLVNLPALAILVAIPQEVTWSISVFGLIFLVGLITIFLRGSWQNARGFDKLILFAPLFYGAPLAAFGTEHFTQTRDIASLVPAWIPFHYFWTYLVGICFIAAGLSLVTKVQARLAASLLTLTFFLFVVLMDLPALVQDPRNRFVSILSLRELSFSAGALALAACLTQKRRKQRMQVFRTIARYVIAIAVLFYSFEQFLHGDHVPGIPLERITPHWIFGHGIWTYLTAAAYAAAGIPLLLGKKTRAAAISIGLTVLLVELVVYLPMGIVERASLEAFNYWADTLMFFGAVLLIAAAMPRENSAEEVVASPSHNADRMIS